MREVKLHFGCGTRVPPGWINIDGWPSSGIDFISDIRQPLPFSDASCRLIFTEHAFEHIHAKFRLPILRELSRILEPEGTLRIVVPDRAQFVNAYSRHDVMWFQDGMGTVPELRIDSELPSRTLCSLYVEARH